MTRRCPTCDGRGSFAVDTEERFCERCNGSGALARRANRRRFKVFARLDGARAQPGTVTIETHHAPIGPIQTMRVRPLRRRRTYDLPLNLVAAMVVQYVVKSEVRARLAERRTKKGKR